MNTQKFLDDVAEMLDSSDPLVPDQVLEDIPTYDSLGVLNLLSLYDSMGVQTTPEQVNQARTVQDLIDLAKDKLTDG
jgi:acyl carrier protein